MAAVPPIDGSKYIHRMWYDKLDDNRPRPPEKYQNYDSYEENWRKLNPGHKVVMWNGAMIKKLLEHSDIAGYRDFWRQLPYHIEKCDVARYMIMYIYGGIYVDLDYNCLKSVEEIIGERDLVLVREPEEHENAMNCQLISNSLMASTARNPFWLSVIDSIKCKYSAICSSVSVPTAVHTTGPKLLADVAKLLELPKSVFEDQCKFIPLTFNGVPSSRCQENWKDYAYTYTLWNEGTHWFKEEYSGQYWPLIVLLILAVVLGLVMLWLLW